MTHEAEAPAEPKILTLARVTEIIATTKVPPGQDSADPLIIEKIDSLCRGGYILDKDAEEKISIYRKSGRAPGARS